MLANNKKSKWKHPNFTKNVDVEGNYARDYVVKFINKLYGQTMITRNQWANVCKKLGVSGVLSAKEFNGFIKRVIEFIDNFLASQAK